MAVDAEYDYSIDLLLVGDTGVGKTCLIDRFCKNIFKTCSRTNTALDRSIQTIEMEGKTCRLIIWDCSGRESCTTLIIPRIPVVKGIVLVYDITDSRSFEKVYHNWLSLVQQHAKKSMKKILVGSKCDLTGKRQVEYARGKALANKYGMSFFETSAKDGENVAEALLTIARSISYWLIVEGVKDRNWTDDSKDILDDVRNDQVYELSVTGLDTNGLVALSVALSKCTCLRTLILSSNELSDKGCATLTAVLPRCLHLQTLILGNNRIADEGFAALSAALPRCVQLQALDLSYNSIGDEGCASLSTVLRECLLLRALDLSANQIGDLGCASLSKVLAGCLWLETLEIWGNRISDTVMEELYDSLANTLCKRVKALLASSQTKVDLAKCGLSYLPDEFVVSTSLMDLSIAGNRLISLPSDIGVSLPRLVSLDMSSNALDTVPDSLLACTSLTTLSLASNALDSLPSRLGVSLRQLTSLDVSNNALDTALEDLLACTSLTVLRLASNNLKSLPATLGVSLLQLTSLDVSSNNLDTVTDDLLACTSLTKLSLASNNLKSLPATIGVLLRLLTSLDVFNNDLDSLPVSLVQCAAIKIDAVPNPLRDIPEEYRRSNDMLWGYLRDISRGQTQSDFVRCVLLGSGGAGKSTFLEFIREPLNSSGFTLWIRSVLGKAPSVDGSTAGVALNARKASQGGSVFEDVHTGDSSVKLRFDDFGGQLFYRFAHSYFLFKGVLPVLVWDAGLPADDDDVSEETHIRSKAQQLIAWLDSACSHATLEDGDGGRRYVPVVMIATHVLTRSSARTKYMKLCQRVQKQAEHYVKRSECELLVLQHLAVNAVSRFAFSVPSQSQRLCFRHFSQYKDKMDKIRSPDLLSLVGCCAAQLLSQSAYRPYRNIPTAYKMLGNAIYTVAAEREYVELDEVVELARPLCQEGDDVLAFVRRALALLSAWGDCLWYGQVTSGRKPEDEGRVSAIERLVFVNAGWLARLVESLFVCMHYWQQDSVRRGDEQQVKPEVVESYVPRVDELAAEKARILGEGMVARRALDIICAKAASKLQCENATDVCIELLCKFDLTVELLDGSFFAPSLLEGGVSSESHQALQQWKREFQWSAGRYFHFNRLPVEVFPRLCVRMHRVLVGRDRKVSDSAISLLATQRECCMQCGTDDSRVLLERIDDADLPMIHARWGYGVPRAGSPPSVAARRAWSVQIAEQISELVRCMPGVRMEEFMACPVCWKKRRVDFVAPDEAFVACSHCGKSVKMWQWVGHSLPGADGGTKGEPAVPKKLDSLEKMLDVAEEYLRRGNTFALEQQLSSFEKEAGDDEQFHLLRARASALRSKQVALTCVVRAMESRVRSVLFDALVQHRKDVHEDLAERADAVLRDLEQHDAVAVDALLQRVDVSLEIFDTIAEDIVLHLSEFNAEETDPSCNNSSLYIPVFRVAVDRPLTLCATFVSNDHDESSLVQSCESVRFRLSVYQRVQKGADKGDVVLRLRTGQTVASGDSIMCTELDEPQRRAVVMINWNCSALQSLWRGPWVGRLEVGDATEAETLLIRRQKHSTHRVLLEMDLQLSTRGIPGLPRWFNTRVWLKTYELEAYNKYCIKKVGGFGRELKHSATVFQMMHPKISSRLKTLGRVAGVVIKQATGVGMKALAGGLSGD